MAEFKETSVYCTSLSPELAATAARELNETPATRRTALMEFKQLLLNNEEGKEERSPVIINEGLLIKCLRCKKFNVQRAMSVYEGYRSYRQSNPEIFNNLTPSSVSHIYDSGLLGGLETRDRHGRAVMVSFPGRWDPESQPLEDVLRAMVVQLEHLIDSVETQVNGIVLIADFKEFTLYQARCIRPWFFQMMSSLVQNAFPARFKGVYVLNQPWYISLLMAVISRLLTEKMNNRIHMLGDNYKELSNNFNMQYLPEEFGGCGPSYEGSEWSKIITSAENNKQETTPTLPIHKMSLQSEVK